MSKPQMQNGEMGSSWMQGKKSFSSDLAKEPPGSAKNIVQQEAVFAHRNPRPFGVAAIVGLQIVSAVLIVVAYYLNGKAVNDGENILTILERFPRLADLPLIINYIATLSGFVIAPGLWRLKRWAWVLTMLQLGIRLGTGLVAYWTNDAQYLLMFLNVITVFYLNQRDVQQAFLHHAQHSSLQVGEMET